MPELTPSNCQAAMRDGRIGEAVQRLRAGRHLEGVAEAGLEEKIQPVVRIFLVG